MSLLCWCVFPSLQFFPRRGEGEIKSPLLPILDKRTWRIWDLTCVHSKNTFFQTLKVVGSCFSERSSQYLSPLLLPFLCRLVTHPVTQTLCLPAELSLPLTTFLVPEHLIFNSRVHRWEKRDSTCCLWIIQKPNPIVITFSCHIDERVMLFVMHLYNTEIVIHYFKWHFMFLVQKLMKNIFLECLKLCITMFSAHISEHFIAIKGEGTGR